MSEIINNFDKIKAKFIEIPFDKYEIIKNMLLEYWERITNLLKISIKEENPQHQQLIEFIEYFDPKKTPSSRLKVIEKLPTFNEIVEKYLQIEKEIELMIEIGIFFPITRSYTQFLLLTPEGLVFLFILLDSKKYDNIVRLNTLILQKYEKFIYLKFREFLFSKFERLSIKEDEEIPLTFKDIAIIAFFLVNSSIGKDKAFTREIKGTEKALNCVVQAFDKNVKLNDEQRNDENFVPIRVLQSDLSILQKKIGYAIYNEKSIYYIKINFINFLYDILFKAIKTKDKSDLKSRWEHFLKEYEHWRPLFRESNICYYNYQVVEKLKSAILSI